MRWVEHRENPAVLQVMLSKASYTASLFLASWWMSTLHACPHQECVFLVRAPSCRSFPFWQSQQVSVISAPGMLWACCGQAVFSTRGLWAPVLLLEGSQRVQLCSQTLRLHPHGFQKLFNEESKFWILLNFVFFFLSPPLPFCRMVEYSLDLQNINLSAIRTVRVLRPLKAINRVPSKSRFPFMPAQLGLWGVRDQSGCVLWCSPGSVQVQFRWRLLHGVSRLFLIVGLRGVIGWAGKLCVLPARLPWSSFMEGHADGWLKSWGWTICSKGKSFFLVLTKGHCRFDNVCSIKKGCVWGLERVERGKAVRNLLRLSCTLSNTLIWKVFMLLQLRGI